MNYSSQTTDGGVCIEEAENESEMTTDEKDMDYEDTKVEN